MQNYTVSLKKNLSVFMAFFAASFSAVLPRVVFAQDDPIGTIDKLVAVSNFDSAGGIGEGEIGVLFFMSRLISYITIVAGIWVFANLLLAGYTYVTSSGNAQNHTIVRDKLTMSILGLVLIVTVYAIAGILGTLFFGDAAYLLNPTITGPEAL